MAFSLVKLHLQTGALHVMINGASVNLQVSMTSSLFFRICKKYIDRFDVDKEHKQVLVKCNDPF